MFFALKGENFDGNLYAASALDKGSAVAVVDRKDIVPEGDARFILVDDVLASLQALAAHHRQQTNIPVVQITGTNGKTTTKELLSAVLSAKYSTLFTQGNLNNHIGVPRTLLRLRPEHEIAVVETGANHPGEIAFLCQMVQANCGLITNVGRAHLEGFGSFEGVRRTKGELYDDLHRRGCFAFLNTEDADLSAMATERGMETVPYVQGKVAECNPMLCVRWYCTEEDKWHTVQTNLIGSYNLANGTQTPDLILLNYGINDAAGLSLTTGFHVLVNHVYALNDDLAFLGGNCNYFALGALAVTGDYDNGIAGLYMNLLFHFRFLLIKELRERVKGTS